MPVEIERKFLVVGQNWRGEASPQRFCQGYLASGAGITVRVRRAGSVAFLTVKGSAKGIVRPEYEYPIPVEHAEQMLADLCRRPLVEKLRHEIRHGDHVWQIDEFGGANAGLVLAEVELRHESEELILPPWTGREVTHDRRFSSSALSERPYTEFLHVFEEGCP